jgi:hypothetical protein
MENQHKIRVKELSHENIAIEPKTEDFNFGEHFLNALLAALYYIFVYIPFILPFKIWGKAVTRLSLIWDQQSISYDENGAKYPIHWFGFNYIVNFIFDAIIFLVIPLGFVVLTYIYIQNYEYAETSSYIGQMLLAYFSVIGVRLSKEILFFILNNLIPWLLQILINIGSLLKNLWLLNLVIKKKTDVISSQPEIYVYEEIINKKVNSEIKEIDPSDL